MAQQGANALDPRWYQRKGDDLAKEAYAIATSLETDNQWRCARYLSSLSLYEGEFLDGLYASAYVAGVGAAKAADQVASSRLRQDIEELTYNLSRSACDTVQANIAGAQKPKPMFMTSGADWQTMRKAKKLDKFVEAQLHQPQGRYQNAWELMEDVFLDCAIWGVGAVKCFADVDAEKVALERVYPWELLVDAVEAYHGNPQSLFHVYPMDKDKLVAMFCGEQELDEDGNPKESDSDSKEAQENAAKRDAILSAKTVDDRSYGTSTRVAQSVKVVEAWRLPANVASRGKHVFCIEGKLLHEEPWEDSEFPIMIIRWSNERIGWWGKGLIEEGEAVAREVNDVAGKLSERIRVCSGRRTFVPSGANIKEEALQENESETVIFYDGPQPPTVSDPEPITVSEAQYLETNMRRYYELNGVPQSQAEGTKPKGVESGVAIQRVNDLGARRFSIKAKKYEQSFVTLGQQIVRRTRELAREKPKIVARWPGRDFMRELEWSKISDIREDMYTVRVAPVSALPNDPAGRVDMVETLFARQVITPQQYKRLIDWPDLENETRADTAEHDYVSDLLDDILDAETEGDVKRIYQRPDGHITDKLSALMQVSAEYFDALRKRAPEHNIDALRNYIQQLVELMSKGAPPANSNALGAPGAPVGPQPQPPADPMSAGAPPMPMVA